MTPHCNFDYDAVETQGETVDNIIQRGFKLLQPRTQIILKLRYGLDCQKLTLKECGKLFGISQNRIRQIQFEGLYSLRSYAFQYLSEDNVSNLFDFQ